MKHRTGRGTTGVFNFFAVFWHHCLLFVVVRHAAPALKIHFDFAKLTLVQHQLVAKHLRNSFFGQIVSGGAKTARKHQKVAALFCLLHQGRQPRGIVTHHALAVHHNAQCRQLFGQILRVGV
ncbi:hypothetical protein SDC9_205223 [bioreactor metagenome]|uniref:Uncharacterized protein n=1 Tax=bioreactor metagenome TaxID=1076179 RepID=A0A645J4A9_9ZZZZ